MSECLILSIKVLPLSIARVSPPWSALIFSNSAGPHQGSRASHATFSGRNCSFPWASYLVPPRRWSRNGLPAHPHIASATTASHPHKDTLLPLLLGRQKGHEALSELGTTLSYLVLEFPRLFPIEVLVGQVLFGQIQLRARLCWLEGPGGSSKNWWQAELYWTYFINAIAGWFPISWQRS